MKTETIKDKLERWKGLTPEEKVDLFHIKKLIKLNKKLQK